MKVIDICQSRRNKFGGLMKIFDILAIYHAKNPEQITKYCAISLAIRRKDIAKAVRKMDQLGSCCLVNEEYVCTVPISLGSELGEMMRLAERSGYLTYSMVQRANAWSEGKFASETRQLQSKGILWVDKKTGGEPHYYFLSMLNDYVASAASGGLQLRN